MSFPGKDTHSICCVVDDHISDGNVVSSDAQSIVISLGVVGRVLSDDQVFYDLVVVPYVEDAVMLGEL